jgi:alkylresorcinol/alkylpyrone synthase
MMDTPIRIASVGSALPDNYYDQATLLEAFRSHWSEKLYNIDRLAEIHRNVLVGGRYLALPMDRYPRIQSWGESNDAWIDVAQEVGEQAVRAALHRAGVSTDDVDVFVFVTVTGVATPSMDARLMNRLGLSSRVKRVPVFGLGCVAGAAGVARAADLLRGFPDQVAVLLSVELCSLTLQPGDLSIPNLIASGLFGDGAAAAVLVGGSRSEVGPSVVSTRSVFYPDTERIMGWDITDRGFQIVLSAEVPEMVRRHLPRDVDSFLAEHDLVRSDVGVWVSHPGGPRVLEAMQEALELPEGALDLSWKTLREVGNLSSTSVLLVLEEIMTETAPDPGTWGLMVAMGPGFCSELVLLRW